MSVRQHVPMIDVLEALDIDPPNSSGKIFAPDRDEAVPSVHIYEDGNWYDYGAGVGGDAVDFITHFFGKSRGFAFRWLGELIDGEIPFSPGTGTERTEKQVLDLTERYLSEPAGFDDSIAWFRDLCQKWPTVDPDWLIENGVVKVTRGALWVPHWTDNKIVGVKIRSLTQVDQKWALKGSTFTTRLYRDVRQDEWVATYDRVAILTEGESDAWAVSAHFRACPWPSGGFTGYYPAVFGLPSGAGLVKPEWFEELRAYRKVLFVLDKDKAGLEARDKATVALDGLGIPYWTVGWDPETYGKDIAIALGRGFKLEEWLT